MIEVPSVSSPPVDPERRWLAEVDQPAGSLTHRADPFGGEPHRVGFATRVGAGP